MEKKEERSETVFKWCWETSGRRCPRGRSEKHFCLIPDNWQNQRSVLVHLCLMTASLSLFFTLHIQKKVTRLSQWNDKIHHKKRWQLDLLHQPRTNMADNGRRIKDIWRKKMNYYWLTMRLEEDFFYFYFLCSPLNPISPPTSPAFLPLAGVICSPSHLVRQGARSVWQPLSGGESSSVSMKNPGVCAWLPQDVTQTAPVRDHDILPWGCQNWSRYDLHSELDRVYSQNGGMTGV